ncbi:uncharacterized protein LOC126336112 isoform X2 [Schistocerca gregaria]|nr:uncharacterized protein LOC126336112 isoform X2 [Schistocerca gregaria]
MVPPLPFFRPAEMFLETEWDSDLEHPPNAPPVPQHLQALVGYHRSQAVPPNKPRVPQKPGFMAADGKSLTGPLQLEPEEWPTPEEAATMERLDQMLRAPRPLFRPAPRVILYQQEEGTGAAAPLDLGEWPTPQAAGLCVEEQPPAAAQDTTPRPVRLMSELFAPRTATENSEDPCR